MIIDIYARHNKKEKQLRQQTTQTMNQPPHQNRFIMFMIQHHVTKITKIMKDAGLPQQQINLAFGQFDSTTLYESQRSQLGRHGRRSATDANTSTIGKLSTRDSYRRTTTSQR
eukprot:6217933-Amphidinium_carterae.1